MGDEELLKQFEAVIGGQELADLRGLTETFLNARQPGYIARPNLRRPRRREPVVLVVRVELLGSGAWRTFELPSDLRLDLVHSILQHAFGWSDSHLYRYSLGGGPFDRESQLFLCPQDEEARAEEGIPVSEVSLDEAFARPGDTMTYVYHYGLRWELTLRLEEIRFVPTDLSVVTCLGGQGPAPPEEGGPPTYAFDLAEVNRLLLDPLLVLHKHEVRPDLLKLLQRVRHTPVFEPLTQRGLALVQRTSRGWTPQDWDEAFAPVEELLRQEPVVARPEEQAYVDMLRSLGLVRKRSGVLLPTKAGRYGLVDSGALWIHIAQRLVPAKPRMQREFSLVFLLCAATTSDGELPVELIEQTMKALGWDVSYSAVARGVTAVTVWELLGHAIGGGLAAEAMWCGEPSSPVSG